MSTATRKAVLDVGNTRIKAGFFLDDVLEHQRVIADDEQLAAIIKEMGSTQVLISNVSGRELGGLNQMNAWAQVHMLDANSRLPFVNQYQTRATLGADRLALVAGAQHFFPATNCLVMDAGTCITYDILNSEGTYYGGNIAPGLHMRLRAMHTFTGSLPLPAWQEPQHVLGTNTQSCLLTGAFFGLLGEMEFFMKAYGNDLTGLQVLLCGGDAALLAKHLKRSIFVNEHLLLYGLNKILTVNVK